MASTRPLSRSAVPPTLSPDGAARRIASAWKKYRQRAFCRAWDPAGGGAVPAAFRDRGTGHIIEGEPVINPCCGFSYDRRTYPEGAPASVPNPPLAAILKDFRNACVRPLPTAADLADLRATYGAAGKSPVPYITKDGATIDGSEALERALARRWTTGDLSPTRRLLRNRNLQALLRSSDPDHRLTGSGMWKELLYYARKPWQRLPSEALQRRQPLPREPFQRWQPLSGEPVRWQPLPGEPVHPQLTFDERQTRRHRVCREVAFALGCEAAFDLVYRLCDGTHSRRTTNATAVYELLPAADRRDVVHWGSRLTGPGGWPELAALHCPVLRFFAGQERRLLVPYQKALWAGRLSIPTEDELTALTALCPELLRAHAADWAGLIANTARETGRSRTSVMLSLERRVPGCVSGSEENQQRFWVAMGDELAKNSRLSRALDAKLKADKIASARQTFPETFRDQAPLLGMSLAQWLRSPRAPYSGEPVGRDLALVAGHDAAAEVLNAAPEATADMLAARLPSMSLSYIDDMVKNLKETAPQILRACAPMLARRLAQEDPSLANLEGGLFRTVMAHLEDVIPTALLAQFVVNRDLDV